MKQHEGPRIEGDSAQVPETTILQADDHRRDDLGGQSADLPSGREAAQEGDMFRPHSYESSEFS